MAPRALLPPLLLLLLLTGARARPAPSRPAPSRPAPSRPAPSLDAPDAPHPPQPHAPHLPQPHACELVVRAWDAPERQWRALHGALLERASLVEAPVWALALISAAEPHAADLTWDLDGAAYAAGAPEVWLDPARVGPGLHRLTLRGGLGSVHALFRVARRKAPRP